MTMHNALQPRDDIDTVYVIGNYGLKGLASIDDCGNWALKGFEEYIKKSKAWLITIAINSNNNRTIEI